MSIPSFVPRSDVVKKRKKERTREAQNPPLRAGLRGWHARCSQSKKKKEMARHCRGMNVPRIEDRGLRNSKLDFHPSFARLKNFMPNFIFFIYQSSSQKEKIPLRLNFLRNLSFYSSTIIVFHL